MRISKFSQISALCGVTGDFSHENYRNNNLSTVQQIFTSSYSIYLINSAQQMKDNESVENFEILNFNLWCNWITFL